MAIDPSSMLWSRRRPGHVGLSMPDAAASLLRALAACRYCVPGGPRCRRHTGAPAATAALRILASVHLSDRRRRHSIGVAVRMRQLLRRRNADCVRSTWGDWMCAAAAVHDVGYGVDGGTGHHGIDGARWLAEQGIPHRVVGLVAWHSTGEWEAAERGLSDMLEQVAPRPDPLAAAYLWAADFTTSPTGRACTVAERLAGIRSRYPPGSPVIAALDASLPTLADVLHRVGVGEQTQQARLVNDD